MAFIAKEKLEDALKELDSINFVNILFVFTVIMSLVIKTGNDLIELQIPKIYIMLLLTYTTIETKLLLSVVLATYRIYKAI